jgi:hypothetical protein
MFIHSLLGLQGSHAEMVSHHDMMAIAAGKEADELS